jgi:NADPH:quinone reductase-like Zn-dependent oxidoreductase
MKAITYAEFGGPEVLTVSELPEPEPGPGQIRIAVKAAGINPFDLKVREGMFGGDLPKTTALEAAGVVDALGDRVEDVAVGDRVYGFTVGGAAADFALSAAYAAIPGDLDFVQAAGLPVAIETAARTLDELGVGEGTKLIINGASGAVGIAATQLAQQRGATVVGTASEANHDLLRVLGATPVTYGPGLADRVREIWPDGADLALDTASGALPELVSLTGDPEHVLTIADQAAAGPLGVRTSGGPDSKRANYILKDIKPLIEAGEFAVPIAETFAFTQIADAHRASARSHAPGKIVLTIAA